MFKKIVNNSVARATLTDLSKAFDCIHKICSLLFCLLIIVAMKLYLTYSYLTNRRQCARINNTQSQLETMISVVPLGSILAPILFKLSINDLFPFVALESLYNFGDYSALSAFSTTVSKLIKILESESEVVI